MKSFVKLEVLRFEFNSNIMEIIYNDEYYRSPDLFLHSTPF